MHIKTINFSECSKSYTDKELSEELANLAGAENVSGRVELIDPSILLKPRQAKAHAVKVFESFGFPCVDIGRNTRLIPSHQIHAFDRDMEDAMKLYDEAGDDFRFSWSYNSDAMVQRFHSDVQPRVRRALDDRAPKTKDFKARITSICIGDMPSVKAELTDAQNQARISGYNKGMKDMACRVQDAILDPVRELHDRLINSGGGSKTKRITETATSECLRALTSIAPVLKEFGDNLDLKEDLESLLTIKERYGNLQPREIITSQTIKNGLKDDLSLILGGPADEEATEEEQTQQDQTSDVIEETPVFKSTKQEEVIDWDAEETDEEIKPTNKSNTLEEEEFQW